MKMMKRSPGEKKEPLVPLIIPLVNPSQPLRAWFGGQVGTLKGPGTVKSRLSQHHPRYPTPPSLGFFPPPVSSLQVNTTCF